MSGSRVLCAMALASICVAAPAQQLWQGARAGMTPQEVQRAFPQAQSITGPATPSGARALLHLPGVTIEEVSFDAEFLFLDDRLDQVQLRARVHEPLAQSSDFFDRLKQDLRAKYGPEASHEQRSDAQGTRNEAQWFTPDAMIDAAAQMHDDASSFHVIYRSRAGPSNL